MHIQTQQQAWNNVIRAAYINACREFLAGNKNEFLDFMEIYKGAVATAPKQTPIPSDLRALEQEGRSIDGKDLEKAYNKSLGRRRVVSLRGREFYL